MALIRAGLAIGGCGVAVLAGLHLAPRFGGVDPVAQMLSDYASGPAGWAFRAAMVAVSVGSGLLGVAMARAGLLDRRLPTAVLGTWCVALLGIAACTKDPPHTPPTPLGVAHLWFTSVGCVCLPVFGALLCWRWRREPRWRRWVRLTWLCAAAGLVCTVPFVVAFFAGLGEPLDRRFDGLGTGLVERVMVLLDVAATLVCARWASAMARRPAWRADLDASMLQVSTSRDTC